MVKTVVGNGVGIGITASVGVNEIEKAHLIVKSIKKLETIPNKVFVQYRKNSLIEKPVKKIIYSFINHELGSKSNAQTLYLLYHALVHEFLMFVFVTILFKSFLQICENKINLLLIRDKEIKITL